MDELEKLYSGDITTDHSECNGCSILKLKKQFYCKLEPVEPCDILCITESYVFNAEEGKYTSIGDVTREFVLETIQKYTNSHSVQFLTAIKCHSVKETDMATKDWKICRKYLQAEIPKANPKLIFTFGSIALRMLLNKRGLGGKRGKTFEMDLDGNKFTVVPIYNPVQVFIKPELKYFFDLDIKNALSRHIVKDFESDKFPYDLILTEEGLDLAVEKAKKEPFIAIDIETTGLNFNTDTIHTIGFAGKDLKIVIPVYHKEHVWGDLMPKVVSTIQQIIDMPQTTLNFMQNGKFDTKFLNKIGVTVNGFYDTKLLGHALNEVAPKDLKSMVDMYFPEDLEDNNEA